jgi:RNA 3'-terminal phosphate cyclase (ATP)
MLTIDGSTHEGGGQLVRSAVALSAITGTPIVVEKVRERRATPGLAAQHLAAVKAVAGMCGAKTRGLSVGSRWFEFVPGTLRHNDFFLDVGTAGSISLVLQAWIPVALHTGGRLVVEGGTEVRMSPTIDYLDHIFGRALRSQGAKMTIRVLQRGYYPRGGGRVEAEVTASVPDRVELGGGAEDEERGIISCSSGLPDHVVDRQGSSAQEAMRRATGEVFDLVCDRRMGPSAGSSVTAWCGFKGGSALGKRGLPAEKVGEAAANELIGALSCPGIVDVHLADQLLIYIAQYGGTVTTSEKTRHAETMCWLLGLFGYRVRVQEGATVEFSG